MKASELATRLLRLGDLEVLVWAPDFEGEIALCPIADISEDCFAVGAPHVILIDIDRSNTTTDAISDWVDGEGELPEAKRHHPTAGREQ